MQSRPKIVVAFTHADDDRWLPPGFVVGGLHVRHVPGLDYDQYSVDGIGVDKSTIVQIPDPTPELIRVLKRKSSEWARQDRTLARKRARKDSRFREKGIDEEFGVHMVREDRQEGFGAFCDEMRREDQRLTAARSAKVAELLKENKRKAR